MKPNLRKFYLFGENISTSLSPQIHNYLFKVKGRENYVYQCYSEGKLPSVQELLADENFGGGSITIPFKEEYHLTLQDGKKFQYGDEFASRSKITNTLVRPEGPSLIKAYNTDLYGIKRVMDSSFDEDLVKGSALILGAGATSHIFCEYLSSKLSEIVIINRTKSKIDYLSVLYTAVTGNLSSSKIGLIINTLPTKIIEQNSKFYEELLLEKVNLQKEVVFMDVNYRDSNKILLKMIMKGGSSVRRELQGIDMLIWQAIKQNALFCQQEDNKDENNLFDMVKKELGV